MKTFLKILAGLVLLAVIAYFTIMNLPQADIKSEEADISIQATDIYNAYSTDENVANTTYLGKIINVTGKIEEMYDDEAGDPVILMSDSDGQVVALVTLEPDQKSAMATYQVGQEITVKAKCSGMLMEVALTKGIIVK
jgi:hypothetical protein